ncbi:hypothetical protein LIER_24726 [Lithospermum erythrorhizon]|uniref:Uncharacterized protein n=1 Tax=Lithospermum erythrorhizon TaxID=34254 RepID=A0AAV3R6G0_LITER
MAEEVQRVGVGGRKKIRAGMYLDEGEIEHDVNASYRESENEARDGLDDGGADEDVVRTWANDNSNAEDDYRITTPSQVATVEP